MIVGVPPFYHKNKKKMYYLIKELPVKFPDPIKHGVEVSELAQDLISKVSACDCAPTERFCPQLLNKDKS